MENANARIPLVPKSQSYLLPDLIAPGLRLLFCGSALGAMSYRLRAPYANPANKFWRTLHEAGITPRRFVASEYKALLELGIGFTDLNKTQFGNDDVLAAEHDDVASLMRKVKRYKPGILAFTAKRPAQVFLRETFGLRGPPSYGLQGPKIGDTCIFVLTSPSGRAGSFWTLEPWRELGRLLNT
jgi:TDG/mug DNA glycosylase family protein